MPCTEGRFWTAWQRVMGTAQASADDSLRKQEAETTPPICRRLSVQGDA